MYKYTVSHYSHTIVFRILGKSMVTLPLWMLAYILQFYGNESLVRSLISLLLGSFLIHFPHLQELYLFHTGDQAVPNGSWV